MHKLLELAIAGAEARIAEKNKPGVAVQRLRELYDEVLRHLVVVWAGRGDHTERFYWAEEPTDEYIVAVCYGAYENVLVEVDHKGNLVPCWGGCDSAAPTTDKQFEVLEKHLEKKICDGSYRLCQEAEDVVAADPGAGIGEEFVVDVYSLELPEKLAQLSVRGKSNADR